MENLQQNEILTPEEKLRLLGDKIISSIIHDTDICKKNRRYVFSIFKTDVFKNENYLIYHALYRFRDIDITLDEEFLEMFYMNNTKILKEADTKIDIQAFKQEQEDEYLSYIGATIKNFKRLLGMQPQSEDSFKLICEKYRLALLAIEAEKIYTTANRVLASGITLRGKYLMGYDDSKAFIHREFARLDAISERDAGEGFVAMRGREESASDKKVTKIADWDIKELDEHFHGLFTSTFYSFLAPPKAGKTKFCAHLAHGIAVRNAVKYGKGHGVVVWALEGGRVAFDSQLRAKHFDYMYNKDVTDARQKKVGISAGSIKSGIYDDEKIRQLEDASRIDLYNNPNYGEIMYIELDCELDTFIMNIDTAVQTIDAKAVVIDYLQLINTQKGGKKSETIGEAYKALLRYCNAKNIAVLAPAQYTQEFIKDISKNGSNSADIRTAGGESAEIVRTPDVNIALWASEEDLIRGQMSMLSVPSRTALPFAKFDLLTDLGCCNFYSMPEYMKQIRKQANIEDAEEG